MAIRPLILMLALGTGVLIPTGSDAQLLPQVGGLPGQVVGNLLGPASGGSMIGGVVDSLGAVRLTEGLSPASLLDQRRARLRTLVRDNRGVLEVDDAGNPVRRGEVIAIDPSPAVLNRAVAAGFTLARQDRIEGLDVAILILTPPKGQDVREGLKRLRKIAPDGQFELNHILEPAGGMLMAAAGPVAASVLPGGAAIGMIDGGVAAHPSLTGARIEQRGFAPGGPKGSGHGTAVASLLVGDDGKFVGAARGAGLLVADVYGGDPAAGSAEMVARALGWLGAQRVGVINISLVGPANQLVERSIAALRTRGVLVVAAVGNDGPAAPVQYPAAYPGVIAVTGVDARNRALTEAGRAAHLDFAAPGADMAAALPGKGYARVRGTSFAAPLVTARLAHGGADAVARVAAEVQPGKGKVGRGVVCGPCRIAPTMVDAR